MDLVLDFNTPQDPRWNDSGASIEYALRMRRFDDAARLDRGAVCATRAAETLAR
ncbi:MAG: hypothetical protein IPH35_25305 [Rhodoferax sp.]|nr:hypothetical protein [Rhodoferax sp.]